ncbi:MAG: redoxin domain-containing protein, partial [Planctomycetaceae bacterium]
MMTQQQLTHVLAVFSGILIGAGLLACLGQYSPPVASISASAVDSQSVLPHHHSGKNRSAPSLAGKQFPRDTTAAQASDLQHRTSPAPASSLQGSARHAKDDGDREPLKGYDLDGSMIRLGAAHSSRAITLIFLGTECPVARSSIPKLNQLFDELSPHGVEFYAVFSDPHLTRAELQAHVNEFSIHLPVLLDITGDLAHRLKNEITPQAFVLS